MTWMIEVDNPVFWFQELMYWMIAFGAVGAVIGSLSGRNK
jgi:hypothetical protein